MFQHGASCYESASTVNQLTGASQSGSVVVIGGQSYVLAVSGVTDTSITYDYAPASGGAHISQTIQISPPDCALLTASDALQIGWAIAVLWLTVYGITFIANYIKRETFGVNDDA